MPFTWFVFHFFSVGLKVACVVAVADASNARALLHEPAPANLSNHLAQQVRMFHDMFHNCYTIYPYF